MSFSPLSSGLLGRPVATGHLGVVLALASTSVCFATALAIYGLVGLLAAQNEREANWMMLDMQGGRGHVATLVDAYARKHGRADR